MWPVHWFGVTLGTSIGTGSHAPFRDSEDTTPSAFLGCVKGHKARGWRQVFSCRTQTWLKGPWPSDIWKAPVFLLLLQCQQIQEPTQSLINYLCIRTCMEHTPRAADSKTHASPIGIWRGDDSGGPCLGPSSLAIP